MIKILKSTLPESACENPTRTSGPLVPTHGSKRWFDGRDESPTRPVGFSEAASHGHPLKTTKTLVCFLCLGFIARLHAVYAPIPQVEQGKAFTLYADAGSYYDTNIFGAARDERSSFVYQVTPTVAFNYSAGPRSFLSANYRLSLDHIANRPGDKTLDSHQLMLRGAHTFSPRLEIDVTENFELTRNPASLLPGVGTVLNTDQSFRRNQLDARVSSNFTRRIGAVFRARTSVLNYENDALSQQLDRDEWIVSAAGNYLISPKLKAAAEYRHQVIGYDFGGELKDKDSDFFLGGLDYAPGEKLALTARLGAEQRRRETDGSTSVPFAELGAKYDYGKGAFVAFGYSHSIEEVSNLDRYLDRRANRFFANIQQPVSPQLSATASVEWESAVLSGREGVSPDRDEENLRLGLTLTYVFRPRISLAASVDYDDVRSEDADRDLRRLRTGLTFRLAY